MFSTNKKILALMTIMGIFAISTVATMSMTLAQTANATPQTTAPVIPPSPAKVAAGQTEAMKLLFLMDADKSGKISRAEFMAFMDAEFDRLDVNHDGELDLKELEQSQLMVAHRGGTHR